MSNQSINVKVVIVISRAPTLLLKIQLFFLMVTFLNFFKNLYVHLYSVTRKVWRFIIQGDALGLTEVDPRMGFTYSYPPSTCCDFSNCCQTGSYWPVRCIASGLHISHTAHQGLGFYYSIVQICLGLRSNPGH